MKNYCKDCFYHKLVAKSPYCNKAVTEYNDYTGMPTKYRNINIHENRSGECKYFTKTSVYDKILRYFM